MRKRRSAKPTVYLDTNVVSAMFCPVRLVSTAHHQTVTREWWATERKSFKVHGSVLIEDELSQGEYEGQEKAIVFARRLPYLQVTSAVRDAARELIATKVVPAEKPGDALHLACAIVHRIDYLVTWNYAHLANVDTQRKLGRLCHRERWRAPLLVSPENIPRVTYGQDIRRDENA